MIQKTEFELRQWQRLNYLKKEKEIVEAGRKGAKGWPVMALHDIRIEQMERFLGLR